ncbi:AsnC family transcriptional regulator [Mycobacterium sp. ACS1612]|uniref:Lrp/AsnC family transcriptional regulator n=1 Tax=Mycobacterium sp. ACS1612 TaxID=1834117 RepID=UPI0008020B73|nr:AsnC family transcriptional regulator [Mycobacterium sp. ACS1612]OBF37695.1 AsnC family transcriptional regulator [Mycobacterium sp. ACS1612]
MVDIGDAPHRPPLDHISKAIISALQQNGRRSYSAIAEQVGISEGAVRQRVQRLMSGGVMQIVAVTDPTELGFGREAMIGICCSGDSLQVAEKLTEVDAIDYVVVTAGRFDVVVEVVCEDDAELLNILNTQIRSLPGVYLAETLVYLKTLKQQYNWGTR